MSEEDAFLDGIAADRADRTRLLVFADWLADRSDPREEFVRLHAKLLDMDGTEPGFAELDKEWDRWVGSGSGPHHHPPPESGLLTDRWLDAMCRVCTSADVEPHLRGPAYAPASAAERTGYECANPFDSITLYHGLARDFVTPFEFLVGTILTEVRGQGWLGGVVECYPITRGAFWRLWREQLDGLLNPPPLPETAPDNHFLGAQYLSGGWPYWAIVAVYQYDCFALFWSTTD